MSDEPIALFSSLCEYLCNVAAAGNDLQQLEQHVKKLNERQIETFPRTIERE